ncbi:uncharacterized protein LOC101205945 [Cucumis sativus]|uniref:Protein kinase domain-containing protein n=1 Tax=Cucumis sativus TaxID=3659 RepID=A0A0A0L6U5_CUCSA|nr:uncharacterized protein LOC101205945 [Cucumis sativus]KGN56764.1 hypothetical protein Csa_009997 [Cucumis sativus]
MAREVHGVLSQQLYMERPSVVSDVRITADHSVSDVCVQTGEVFSPQFMRDRVALRRFSDMSDGDQQQQQQKRKGFGFNPSNQLVYEDLSGILGLKRMNSESSSEMSSTPMTAYAAEKDNKVYPNTTSKCQWEYNNGTGQASAAYADETNRGVQIGPMMSALYPLDSPHSCYPCGAGFGDFSANDKMKFLCSFGGRILPRPNDGKLRYVAGETRIISIRKNISYEELTKKTYAVCKYAHTIKYQLPGEDLDSLISVCSDEDLHHMIEEYQELENAEGSQRLRIFLISSNDCSESPTSIEGRVVPPIDVDYQYVAAVNGILDPSLQRSSSGQSFTSQNSQVGAISDHSPNFRTDSSHATDVKDVSSLMPNLMGMLPRPGGQLLNPIQVPRKSLNQSPLISPVTVMQKDFRNVDATYAEDARNFSPIVSGKHPCDSVYYVDAMGRHNYLYHGSPLMNYYHEKSTAETDETYKVLNVHFPRSSSEDFVPAPIWGLSDTHPMKTMLKERAVNYEQLCSDAEYLMQLRSGTTHMGQRIIHSHSEPLLLEQDQKPNHGGPYPLTSFNDSDQSPSLAMSSSLQDLPTLWKQRDGVEFQYAKYENHRKLASGSDNETYEECNFDGKKNNFNGIIYAPSLNDEEKYRYLQHAGYRQNGCPPKEVQNLRGRSSAERGIELENSADTTGAPSLVYHFERTAPKDFEESQYSTKDQPTTSDIVRSQPLSCTSSDLLPHTIQAFDDVKIINQKPTWDSSASGIEISLGDENFVTCHYCKVAAHSRRKSNCDDAISHSDDSHGNEDEDLAVIVEDVTHSLPPDIPLASGIVPRVENEASDEFPSSRGNDALSSSSETDHEDADSILSSRDESMSEAAIAEIEAGIYGLQIIKDADLEELQELGSGTFGTVFHGKWRGTDVAIKRIKKSCFSGSFSEQERLTRDFWREARILSTLHHPNVLAFYGVVPDGPDGTLATVTEYMVNGSLRHVLLRKDKVLDRRKRLIIAMDAAFGMEYLHLKNIVHFDLKCDNLLVNLRDPERPICKVGDFGLSRIKRNTLVSGGVRGTLPWMAPELLDSTSSKVSEKVDVFSFGIAMWEILTGEEPYANMHCGAIIGGIVSNTLRPPIPKRCDPEWKKLMEECWSPEPAARPSFTEITNRLRSMSVALQIRKRPNVASR